MNWQPVQTDLEFIEFHHFINDQYRLRFPNSPGTIEYIHPSPPKTLSDGTIVEQAVVVRNRAGCIIGGLCLEFVSDPRYPDLQSHAETYCTIPGEDLGEYLGSIAGIHEPSVVEIRPLAVAYHLPRAERYDVLQALCSGVSYLAQRMEANLGIAVVRPYVYQLLTLVGAELKRVPNVCLNRQDASALRILLSLYEAVFPEIQKRLQVPLTQAMIDSMTLEEMQQLVNGVPDGHHMYFCQYKSKTQVLA